MIAESDKILVTGGTGSFGRTLVRFLLALSSPPQAIRIFSRDEAKQEDMAREYRLLDPDNRLRFLIGDVRDLARLERALNGIDLVVHAAALKRVVSCEYSPFEAVKTNIMGTTNVIEAAINAGVKKAIFISSDKACMPVNGYGATKMVAEKIWVSANHYAGRDGTRFSVCRYGNVIGSRGSVIPLWRDLAAKGQSLSLTDRHMTRFWLRLEDGAAFVWRCLQEMQGGEIFVPKLPAARMVDVAQAVAPGARLTEVGIRPGEKVHEVLIAPGDEARRTDDMGWCYRVKPAVMEWGRSSWSGSPVGSEFVYTSGSPSGSGFMDVGEIRRVVG